MPKGTAEGLVSTFTCPPVGEPVLAAYRAVFPPDHPNVLRAMGSLAITYSALGRPEDAQLLRDELDRLRS